MSTSNVSKPGALDSDERQPLLSSSRAESNENPIITNDEETGQEPLLGADPVLKGRSWKTISAYVLLGILGVVLLGFFIKGFIDSDDVEVRLCDGTTLGRLVLTIGPELYLV